MSAYVPFSPPVSVRGYRGAAGPEPSGFRLPWAVLDSLAFTTSRKLPDQYEVIGEFTDDDGRAFLQFGVTTAYIEATTSHRWDPTTGRLRLRCQSCAVWDGKHAKGCLG